METFQTVPQWEELKTSQKHPEIGNITRSPDHCLPRLPLEDRPRGTGAKVECGAFQCSENLMLLTQLWHSERHQML